MSMNAPPVGSGWPSLMRDAIGKRVRLTREASNGVMTLPVGFEGTISDGTGWHRLSFKSAPCGSCGVQARVSQMSWRDFEYLG